MTDITAMLDGYLPLDLVGQISVESMDLADAQALYLSAGVEEAKRLRKAGKSTKGSARK